MNLETTARYIILAGVVLIIISRDGIL